MSTVRAALPAQFTEDDALRRRLNDVWLTTGTVPVAHIVADPEDTFEDDAICAGPGGATPGAPACVELVVTADTIVQWSRQTRTASIRGMQTRTST